MRIVPVVICFVVVSVTKQLFANCLESLEKKMEFNKNTYTEIIIGLFYILYQKIFSSIDTYIFCQFQPWNCSSFQYFLVKFFLKQLLYYNLLDNIFRMAIGTIRLTFRDLCNSSGRFPSRKIVIITSTTTVSSWT